MSITDKVNGSGPHYGEGRSDRSSPASSPSPAGPGTTDGASPPPPRAQVLEELWDHFSEFRAYGEEVMRIEKERAKLGFRESMARIRTEAIVTVALCALVLAGSIYTLLGLSAGLQDLFDERPWIGNLLLGVAALAAAGIWATVRKQRKDRKDLEEKIAEHEQREAEQRARFGRHIADRVAAVDRP
jgi:hypothetical protein